MTAEEERTYSPLALLAEAVKRMPDLAVLVDVAELAVELHEHDGWPPGRELLEALRDRAAGALRLTARTLEGHGRNVGYDIAAWRAHGLTLATLVLVDARRDENAGVAASSEEVRAATDALAAAIVACEASRIEVPERLSEAIGHLLVLHVLSQHLLGNLA